MQNQTKIEQLKELLSGLDYEIYQDKLLMANAKVGAEHYGIDLKQCTPTFILKADGSYLAVIIQGNRKLDFKKLKHFLGVKNVTMAPREEILSLTDSPIGSVCLINPRLKTLIDSGIRNLDYCYGGCGVEKYTLKIKANDLITITNAFVEDFSKLRNAIDA